VWRDSDGLLVMAAPSRHWKQRRPPARGRTSPIVRCTSKPDPWIRSDFGCRQSLAILVVGDLFHPIDELAVERFLNGDMRHGCC
jgi:hypothetical protein